MPGREKSLDIFDTFISTAKENPKLPARVLPQYQAIIQVIHQLCQRLQTTNKKTCSRWLHRFNLFEDRDRMDNLLTFAETTNQTRAQQTLQKHAMSRERF